MAIGTIGKYERLDVLGHGTSGVVYLAWDTLLRRQVALKEIRAAGPELERVLDEARVLDRLGRHPHIVEVHSVDSENGAVLIDMELVRGGNLADVLRERAAIGHPLPLGEAVRIALAVLDALSFAHGQRIVHQDVKPANILIGTDGTIKLTDFGLAEALGTGSVAGGGGTYPYMAPEDFAENAASDQRSDLWAVGVVLYEMATGQRPFQVAGRSKDPFAWQRVIRNDQPRPASAVRPGLPVALDVVLQHALAKDKNDRYPDARGFIQALRAVPVAATDTAITFTAATEGDASPFPASLLPGALRDRATIGMMPADSVAPAAPMIPFRFTTGATAYTLDELLPLAARNWNEARGALLDGRLERFLRAIGEVYIADLARELRARGGDDDRRLREFLDRSRAVDAAPEGDERKDAAEGTVPAVRREAMTPSLTGGNTAAAPPAEPSPGPRTRSWVFGRRREQAEDALREHPRDAATIAAPPMPAAPWSPAPAAPVPIGAAQTAPFGTAPVAMPDAAVSRRPAGRWWFWPLFLLCLGPIAAAILTVGAHGSLGSARQLTYLLRGWRATGFLSALLLVVGLGARFTTLQRVLSALPIAAGLIASGALVSRVLGAAHPTPGALNQTAIGLLLPLAVLLVATATIGRAWRLWAWLVVGGAFALTRPYIH